jgi:hypothetical protein
LIDCWISYRNEHGMGQPEQRLLNETGNYKELYRDKNNKSAFVVVSRHQLDEKLY